VQSLERLLAADELERTTRFYFAEDQRRFIIGRGLLRIILGRYLNSPPERLSFCYGQYGKPALASQGNQDMLKFNVSHSGGLVLYAIASGREVGIDLERVRAGFEYERMAERFFSPKEFAEFSALPANMKPEAFFNGWTRKEAYIKARGQGLALPLHSFDVSLAPGQTSLLTISEGDKAGRWALQALMPEPGYAGAVAAEGRDWQLKSWQWTEELP
jgi:4'-phosphopantetheinyl transferase